MYHFYEKYIATEKFNIFNLVFNLKDTGTNLFL